MRAMRGFPFAVIRRLLIIIPVLWAVVTLVFLLIHIVPGDPARQLVGENATEEQYQAARNELGLNKPLPEQYADYWRGLVRGDWGTNPVTRQPVLGRIASIPCNDKTRAGGNVAGYDRLDTPWGDRRRQSRQLR